MSATPNDEGDLWGAPRKARSILEVADEAWRRTDLIVDLEDHASTSRAGRKDGLANRKREVDHPPLSNPGTWRPFAPGGAAIATADRRPAIVRRGQLLRVVMSYLSVTEAQLPAIRRTIQNARLVGIHMSPPFLGRSLIQCPDADVMETLERVVRDLSSQP